MTMWLRHSAPETCGMPSHTVVPTPSSPSLSSVRAHRGEDAAELQRRLEAFLLIARRVFPAVSSDAA